MPGEIVRSDIVDLRLQRNAVVRRGPKRQQRIGDVRYPFLSGRLFELWAVLNLTGNDDGVGDAFGLHDEPHAVGEPHVRRRERLWRHLQVVRMCWAQLGNGSCVVGGTSLFSFTKPPPELADPAFLGTA